MPITVKEKDSGAVLAEGEAADVVRYEGNVYFTPEGVQTELLQVTERTYTCPYKGTCHSTPLTLSVAHP